MFKELSLYLKQLHVLNLISINTKRRILPLGVQVREVFEAATYSVFSVRSLFCVSTSVWCPLHLLHLVVRQMTLDIRINMRILDDDEVNFHLKRESFSHLRVLEWSAVKSIGSTIGGEAEDALFSVLYENR